MSTYTLLLVEWGLLLDGLNYSLIKAKCSLCCVCAIRTIVLGDYLLRIMFLASMHAALIWELRHRCLRQSTVVRRLSSTLHLSTWPLTIAVHRSVRNRTMPAFTFVKLCVLDASRFCCVGLRVGCAMSPPAGSFFDGNSFTSTARRLRALVEPPLVKSSSRTSTQPTQPPTHRKRTAHVIWNIANQMDYLQ